MANFLFVLRKDYNEAATRCFQLAKIANTKSPCEAKVFNF
jgi:hypothetical protein